MATAEQDESTTVEPEIPLHVIEAAIRSVRHGVVQIIIQDGRIVQIEKTDKIRLDRVRTRGR